MMTAGDSQAAAQSYLQMCKELGIGPCQPFLQCLQERSRSCRLAQFDNEKQVYATANLLPYSQVQEADFAGLELPVEGWILLLDSCSKCQQLRVLSLKSCNLGSLGHDVQGKLANLIGACHVTVLDISSNGLGDTFMLPFSQTSLLGGGSSLTVVDLSGNQFSDDGVAMLANSMENEGLKCQLKQLDISFNNLGDKGAFVLASLISRSSLLALELEGNQIGDAGAIALVASWKDAACLRRLNLNSNRFSARTLFAVSDALRLSTSTLHELAVAGVSGGLDGIAAVLQAACSSRCLQLLDIRGPALGLQAVHAVCQLLASPVPLVTLRLDVASKEGAELIAQALPNNSNLLHLMMGGPVPEHVLSFVAASLSSNTLSKLQRQGNILKGTMPEAVSTCPAQRQLQQQLWATTRPASAGKKTSGSSSRACTPAGTVRSSGSAGCTGNAGLLGSGVAVRPVLVRSTTQQARNLSALDPSGGGAANKAAEVFRRHDSDNSGFLDAEEMMAALQDLGMLEGMKARQLGKFLTNTIREADVDKDGRVNLEDFIKYYERLARHYAEAARQGRIGTRRKAPVMPVDAASNEHLKRVFRAYCKLRVGQGRQVGASNQHMNAAQFNQMCRDAGLLDPTGPLSQCAVDIVFTRCKPPGSRRLSFKEFLEAVASVAEEAGCPFEAVSEALVVSNATSPPPSATSSPDQMEGGYCRSARLLATAAARGALGLADAKLYISDLLDNKIGPQLPLGVSNESTGVAMSSSCKSSVQAPMLSPAKQGYVTSADAGMESPPVAAVPQRLSHSRAAASVRFTDLKVAATELADRDGTGVQNPLYEAVDDDEQVQTKQLTAHLNALEGKLAERAECLAAPCGSISAKVCRDNLLSRLQSAEFQIVQQRQQLATVVEQQGAIKEALVRLVESLEGQKVAANQATNAEVVELQQQVKVLSLEVGQLHVLRARLEESAAVDIRLQELSQRVEDRQMRAETAIYQVARQVDVLDAKLRDEIDSSMSALQAILSTAPEM